MDYLLTTTYACALITVQDDKITDTAPIYRWMIGRRLEYVISYLEKKRQFVRLEELG